MSWIQKSIENLAVNILKQGQIPNHVALIMDGNRRFATKSNIDKNEGHQNGYKKMLDAIDWCVKIGIKEMTVYAFSIENFRRSQGEVSLLLLLFVFALSINLHKFHEKGVRVSVFGNLKLLPKNVQKTIAEAMLLTKDNKSISFNIAIAYTSRDEITNCINTIIQGVKSSELREEDVCEELLEACLYTRKISDPDLLIRTSGEIRLSDFLLWQSSSTVLYFTNTLWPEFTIWHMLKSVFYYQKCYNSIIKFKNHLKNKKTNIEDNERVKRFLENLDKKRAEYLSSFLTLKSE